MKKKCFATFLGATILAIPGALTSLRAAAADPAAGSGGIRLPTPANGAAFAMPELDARSPSPKMPGGPTGSVPQSEM